MDENSNNLNKYRLSIRFSSDGFSLYINDETGQLISSKEIPCPLFTLNEQEIIQLLSGETETLQEFDRIDLICECPVYTTVPKAFFNPENAEDYLLFQFEKKTLGSIVYNPIFSRELVLIFSMPIALKKALEIHFDKINIIHHLTYFLEEVISKSKNDIFQIQIRSNAFDAVIQRAGKIQLINSYSFNTDEDICYHILNIFEKLSIDTENYQVEIYNSKNKANLLNLLQKYIKYCNTAN